MLCRKLPRNPTLLRCLAVWPAGWQSKSVFLYVHMSIRQHVCLSENMYVHEYVCISLYAFLSVCMSVCLHVCMSICTLVCLYVFMSLCPYVCMTLCPYVCLSVCLCTHACISSMAWYGTCECVCIPRSSLGTFFCIVRFGQQNNAHFTQNAQLEQQTLHWTIVLVCVCVCVCLQMSAHSR